MICQKCFKRKNHNINLPVVSNYFKIQENKNAQKREVLNSQTMIHF